MDTLIIPDKKWYKEQSRKESVSGRCQFASPRKCPKYFFTYNQLTEFETCVPKIDINIKEEILAYWKEQKELFLTIPHNHPIGVIFGSKESGEREPSSFDNLCPEASYETLKYYACSVNYFYDKYDRNYFSDLAKKDNLPNDWRYSFSSITPEHYTDCNCYEQMASFNEKNTRGFLEKKKSNYIDEIRIHDLRNIKSSDFCLEKLIRLCEEINIAHQNNAYFTVAILSRAIVDHIPPVFGHESFSTLVNNYSFSKSTKKLLLNLQNSMRNVSDDKLHQVMQKKSILPTEVQVNFSCELDILLGEILAKLSLTQC